MPPMAESATQTISVAASPEHCFDVALDFAGHAATTLAALRRLATGGRLVLVAINLRQLTLDPYADVLGRERRIVGCSDHTRDELVELMALAASGAAELDVAGFCDLAGGGLFGQLCLLDVSLRQLPAQPAPR